VTIKVHIRINVDTNFVLSCQFLKPRPMCGRSEVIACQKLKKIKRREFTS